MNRDQPARYYGVCRACGREGLVLNDRFLCDDCTATIIHGSGQTERTVHVRGTDHSQVSQVARDLTADDHHGKLFRLIANGTFWIGALLAVLGVLLVAVGANGDTSFTFFGQVFRSRNVGVAALFLGATLIVLNIRRLLKSIDKSVKRGRYPPS